MRIARKYSSEIVKEALIESLVDGTYDTTAKLMLEEYAEQLATDFVEWTQNNHFIYTTSPTDINHKYWVRKIASIITTRNIYSTNQLYEQFMIERSRERKKNECVIPAVSKSVCPVCGSNRIEKFNDTEYVCEWCDSKWHTEA